MPGGNGIRSKCSERIQRITGKWLFGVGRVCPIELSKVIAGFLAASEMNSLLAQSGMWKKKAISDRGRRDVSMPRQKAENLQTFLVRR